MIPQQAPLLPEPSPDPPDRQSWRGEGLLVTLAALAGAAVVLAGLMGVQRWSGDSSTSANTPLAIEDGTGSTLAPTPTPTPTPTPDTDPDPDTQSESESEPESGADPQAGGTDVEIVACPQQFEGVICDAAEFVQRTRGRPFKRFPNVELLEDGPFDDALVEDLDEAAGELEREERRLKSLGLIPLDLDLFATFESLIQSGVVGFYDPESERLVVRGGEFNLYGQSVLVHELVHAFDDQWFDLGRDDFLDDAEYGFLAVVEGNASRVEELWRSGLSNDQAARLRQEESSALSPEDLAFLLSLPQVILTLQISPYQDGVVYVSRLAAEGGEEAVDEKLLDPPDSSEQVLHPDASAEVNEVVAVDVPSAVGLLIDDGTIGELLMTSWLGPRAAAGWGGDRYITWEAGAETCFAAHIAADSEADLEEIALAAQRWAGQDLPSRRQVERVDADGRPLIRVTGCY